jgi:hypothetical protein
MRVKRSTVNRIAPSAQVTLEVCADSQAPSEGFLVTVALFFQNRPGVSDWACFQKLWNNGHCGMPIRPLPWHGPSLQSTNFSIIMSFTLLLSRRAPYIARSLQAVEHSASFFFSEHPLLSTSALSPFWCPCLLTLAHIRCLAVGPKHHKFQVFLLYSTLASYLLHTALHALWTILWCLTR